MKEQATAIAKILEFVLTVNDKYNFWLNPTSLESMIFYDSVLSGVHRHFVKV
jgi:hypothetical protein